MRIKGIVEEDFLQYKYPVLFIATCTCSFKCCKEQNLPISICQNSPTAKLPDKSINNTKLINRYLENKLTQGIVFGGLEPLDQFPEVIEFVKEFRDKSKDPVIIYTGYKEKEISNRLPELTTFHNIIIKYGRFVPNSKPHFDKVLGINLASDNQYAKLYD